MTWARSVKVTIPASARWPVKLICGHDALVSDHQLYGGFALCKKPDCGYRPYSEFSDPLWRRSRRIEKLWKLVAVGATSPKCTDLQRRHAYLNERYRAVAASLGKHDDTARRLPGGS